MAGKTLTGIGEDESEKLELPADEPEASAAPASASPASAVPAPEKITPPARATDRMPLSFGPTGSTPMGGAPLGTKTLMGERVPLSTIIGAAVPVLPPVDEDKVAEGLKKLRSLDEPLGAIPSSMPTLKEVPIVDPPAPVSPETAAAAVAAELLRSRGTAHGHAITPGAIAEIKIPVSVDDRMKGTLLGHSLHLPDLPTPEEKSRQAEVREIARVVPPSTTLLIPPPERPTKQLSQTHFIPAAEGTDEIEPENPRSKTVARGLIFVAVTSIFIVAAIAWVRAGKTDSSIEHPVAPIQPTQIENAAPAAPATPPPAENAAATPTPAAPAAAATPPPAAAPTPPVPPEAPKVEAPKVEAPKVDEAKPAAPLAHAHAKHHEAPAAAAPKPARPSIQEGAAAAHAAPPPSKPAVPAKGKKADEDPDGTLPLTE